MYARAAWRMLITTLRTAKAWQGVAEMLRKLLWILRCVCLAKKRCADIASTTINRCKFVLHKKILTMETTEISTREAYVALFRALP